MVQGRDTICALSSGRPPAGVAVIRVSGPEARAVHAAFTNLPWVPRKARLARLRLDSGETLDHGLVLNFDAGASFTGEDVVEFHVHGGPAVVRALTEAVCGIPGVRLAEAGEFTRRAFLNGRIDLVSAENLADLVSAETEAQRRLAIANADGHNARRYDTWRRQLISIRARIEADLDFSDEEDVPGAVADQARGEIGDLIAGIAAWSAGYRRAEIIRDGFRVVLLGAPNAGKSSLLNAIARREVALVSDEPGTTRDAIEAAFDLDGMKVVMTDTAGLREDAGKVERMGIERALEHARRADLVLWLADAPGTVPPDGAELLTVATKADLDGPVFPADFRISAVTGSGLGELLGEIGTRARQASGPLDDMPTHWREADLLEQCLQHLRSAQGHGGDTEILAEDLRLASVALGRITGAISVEDLLDDIFSRFCIGK